MAPSLTPAGPIKDWTDEQLIKAIIREGFRPDGKPMLPPMPYGNYANMKADDVKAIVLYLRSLPPKE